MGNHLTRALRTLSGEILCFRKTLVIKTDAKRLISRTGRLASSSNVTAGREGTKFHLLNMQNILESFRKRYVSHINNPTCGPVAKATGPHKASGNGPITHH
ncbi:hypothetical protein CEXT_480491 [Caerostris extrusa]|uniref:Uncharacterized protein n=1 Tax=Caerostris extrusa TaxID=172846 RepID=A0AAV4PYK2_CAEEX|nr:hypothetical protein CEXT_480491 [Caerostris extrusa]